ncbi:MAG: Fe-S cluster assembly protein SufD, partial [Candidatus Omnitrophica bacterium]|nr:Fe-S cluster assembly protein SufD [Candidatus Omnitrophota bacterium]
SAVLPGTRDESWRYTDLKDLARQSFSLVEAVPTSLVGAPEGWLSPADLNLVLANGLVATEFLPAALPAGVTVLTGAQAVQAVCDERFGAVGINDAEFLVRLNDLHFRDILLIDIARGVDVPAVINILHGLNEQSYGKAIFPRIVVRLAEGARSRIFESSMFTGGQPAFMDAVLDIYLAPGAELEMVQSCRNGEQSMRFMSTRIAQQADSRLRSFFFTDGAEICRHNLSIRLEGAGAEAVVNGLHRLDGVRHADSHTFVEHIAPSSRSRQLYKTVIDGEAHSVFNGRILVRRDAQKTNSYQLNKNLLLGREARVDAKPQLEIFADDVKCSHGATIGQLDEDQLFYLGTRGIGRQESVRMLIRGFIDDVVGQVVDPALRAKTVQSMG